MGIHSEVLRYMGHTGKADAQLEALIVSCLEKLSAVCTPHHVMAELPCTVSGDSVMFDTLTIKSSALAVHLDGCTQVFIFAATLGAGVDRLITQRVKMDSAEALCLQACAAAEIEDYCNSVERELLQKVHQHGLHLRPRFSPGYGDFDIARQTDILRILEAHKRIGLTETKTHMLTPLKSVTAVIGAGPEKMGFQSLNKCVNCSKTDCSLSHFQKL